MGSCLYQIPPCFLPEGKALWHRISFVLKGSRYKNTASPLTPRICGPLGFCNIRVNATIQIGTMNPHPKGEIRRRNRWLFVSLLLWLWFILMVWVAESYPTVHRGWAVIAFPRVALASLLVAAVCCFLIRRRVYTKNQQRTIFIWLPVSVLWGAPLLFGVMLSSAALNGFLDHSVPQRHASELIAKRSMIGRGWYSRSLVVRDWRHAGQTARIGGPAAKRAYAYFEPGQKVHVTTRKGFFNAEWIVAVDTGILDNR